MTKFKVGEKVRFIDTTLSFITNKIGTIIVVGVDNNGTVLGVEFDKKFSRGHTCGGRGKNKHCYWVNKEDIKTMIITDWRGEFEK